MKINYNTLIKTFFAFATMSLTVACTSSEEVKLPIVPESTSQILSSGNINGGVINRVGVTTLATPKSIEFPALQNVSPSNYLQAFLDMGLDAHQTESGFVVLLPNAAHFDQNKAFLKTPLTTSLQKIVSEANKNYLSRHRIEVAGHTDITGSSAHNQILSNDRANAAMNEMASLGLNRQRVNARGYGEIYPIHNDLRFNRRVDIVFINP